MFVKYPFLSRFVLFILVPLLIAGAYFYSMLLQSVASYSGEVRLEGLTDSVTIRFDEYGVPNIQAKSASDAWMINGYLHAAERMWQMELSRRLAQGTLSELFGPQSVSSDIWMRTLRIQHHADKAYAELDAPTKKMLIAYSDGVNAWLKQTQQLPPEFEFYGFSPSPWRPEDSIGLQKLFAMNLGGNMYDEIRRVKALNALSPQQLKVFYQHDPESETSESEHNPMLGALGRQEAGINPDGRRFKDWQEVNNYLKQTWSIGAEFSGSNAWVISGAHTDSGLPYLANDPHLSVQQPSPWYVMNIDAKELAVSGMSLVGIPGVVLGKNRHIAWGAARLMADQQDLYKININEADNRSYKTPEGNKPISIIQETIQVSAPTPSVLHKEFKPLKIKIRHTELGPIISDALETVGEDYVLRWVAQDYRDTSFQAFAELQYASNWQEFRDAVSYLKAPAMHFVYADETGNIGSVVAGAIPKRVASNGTVPVSAEEKYYWKGYVSPAELPAEYNPESGIIGAANNKVETKPGLIISHEWAPDYRYSRILALLEQAIQSKKALTLEDNHQIQRDSVDIGAREMIKSLFSNGVKGLILNSPQNREPEKTLEQMQMLFDWDGDYSANKAAASLYRYWIDELKLRMFIDNFSVSNWPELANNSWGHALLSKVTEKQLISILDRRDNQWCGVAKDQIVPCQKELLESFFEAQKKISKGTRSKEPEDWLWGDVQTVKYKHMPFGFANFFEMFFSREEAVGGSPNTINASASYLDDESLYEQGFGVSFRQIMTPGSNNPHFFSLPTGQSGHFLSPHYADLANIYYGREHDTLLSLGQCVENEKYCQKRANDKAEQLLFLAQE